MDVTADRGSVHAVSQLIPAGSVALPAAADALQSAEAQTARWLDTPVGRLDVPIPAEDPLTLAKNGSLLANLINQVQLEASGADISLTSLSNRVVDFPQDVTVRAIVSAYAFPNTLQTIRVTRAVLTAALERSLSYFVLRRTEAFASATHSCGQSSSISTTTIFPGLPSRPDLYQPVGRRVRSIVYQGRELPDDQTLTLCLNNYRASGAGGYGCYKSCPLVSENLTEISDLVTQYVLQHREITVDKTKWLQFCSD